MGCSTEKLNFFLIRAYGNYLRYNQYLFLWFNKQYYISVIIANEKSKVMADS